MRPGPSTFRPNVGIIEMAAYMVTHDLASAPVTTSDGRLVGVLFREDQTVVLVCSQCGRTIQECGLCEDPECQEAICYRDLILALKQSVPTLHEHGG